MTCDIKNPCVDREWCEDGRPCKREVKPQPQSRYGELIEKLRGNWSQSCYFGPITSAQRALIQEAATAIEELTRSESTDTVAVPRSSLKRWREWTEARHHVPTTPDMEDSMLDEMKRLLGEG